MGQFEYKFWMVVCMDDKISDNRHECRAAAERVAKEMAAKQQGKAFAVLEAMKMYETGAPLVNEVTLDFAPMAALPREKEEPL